MTGVPFLSVHIWISSANVMVGGRAIIIPSMYYRHKFVNTLAEINDKSNRVRRMFGRKLPKIQKDDIALRFYPAPLTAGVKMTANHSFLKCCFPNSNHPCNISIVDPLSISNRKEAVKMRLFSSPCILDW
jgi:hypothetical protein